MDHPGIENVLDEGTFMRRETLGHRTTQPAEAGANIQYNRRGARAAGRGVILRHATPVSGKRGDMTWSLANGALTVSGRIKFDSNMGLRILSGVLQLTYVGVSTETPAFVRYRGNVQGGIMNGLHPWFSRACTDVEAMPFCMYFTSNITST